MLLGNGRVGRTVADREPERRHRHSALQAAVESERKRRDDQEHARQLGRERLHRLGDRRPDVQCAGGQGDRAQPLRRVAETWLVQERARLDPCELDGGRVGCERLEERRREDHPTANVGEDGRHRSLHVGLVAQLEPWTLDPSHCIQYGHRSWGRSSTGIPRSPGRPAAPRRR